MALRGKNYIHWQNNLQRSNVVRMSFLVQLFLLSSLLFTCFITQTYNKHEFKVKKYCLYFCLSKKHTYQINKRINTALYIYFTSNQLLFPLSVLCLLLLSSVVSHAFIIPSANIRLFLTPSDVYGSSYVFLFYTPYLILQFIVLCPRHPNLSLLYHVTVLHLICSFV